MGVAQKMIGRVIAVVALAILTHVRSPGLAHAVDPKPMAAGVSEKSSSATAGREKVMTYKPGEKTKGYTCVFMGHSFFYRIAHEFEKVAIGSGFTEHKQVVRVAHGKEGTPGWLWDHVGPKEEARRLLQDEKVDLLAISYMADQPIAAEWKITPAGSILPGRKIRTSWSRLASPGPASTLTRPKNTRPFTAKPRRPSIR